MKEGKRRVRPSYSAEIKAWAVAAVRKGEQTEKAIASSIGCSDRQIRRWLRQTDIDTGRRPGLTTRERQELALLRRANVRLQEQIQLLEEVRDFFSKGTR